MRKYYLVYLLYCSTLLALPKGEKVAYGQVEFNKSSSSLQVNQKTKKAIIEWDSFSIGEKESVQFDQSSKDSAILNRVVGKDLSSIMGSLKANGRVYLLNENGILIGKTGRVDTQSFIASTLRIVNEAFLEGKGIRFEGRSDASIVNLGKISAEKDIYLFARTVENQGTLIAKDSVTLGSGQLLLKEGSQERVFVCPKKSDGSVTNTGRIEAPNVEMLCEGNLYSLAVNHEGIIDATCALNKEGRVLLKCQEGKTRVNGKIINKGSTQILGEKVHLDKDTIIDASANRHAGEVLIGGDYQGKNPKIFNAKITHIDPSAKIFANGIDNGHGGKVIVWGDLVSSFHGHIEAKGGDTSGNGGFVEISSPLDLRYKGFVTTEAFKGKGGELLLDPSNITISTAASNPLYVETSNPDFPDYNPTTATATLEVGDLITSLATNDVVVSTSKGSGGSGTVTISDTIEWGSTKKLTINADRNILVTTTGSIMESLSNTVFSFVGLKFE